MSSEICIKSSARVFARKYRKDEGFECNNDLFELHSWYFRNALVRANYRNVAKGISQDYGFLSKFFRNLLMGENHELKNRYMLVNAPEEWTKEASTEQVQDKYRASTPTSTPTSVIPKNENIKRLIGAIAEKQLSVKEMMAAVGLKDRPNFIEYSLSPAMKNGYVRLLYPDSPRHPRQKYLLTVKGLAVFKEIKG